MTDTTEEQQDDRLVRDPDGSTVAMLPPTGEAPPTPTEQEAGWAVQGTRRGDEIARSDAQQGFMGDLADGWNETALMTGARVVSDEGGALIEEAYGETPLQDAYEEGGVIGAGIRALQAGGMAALSLAGARAGEADYDRLDMYDTLTEGIPFEFHDDILANENLAAAQRARARIQQDLRRAQRVAMQDSGALVTLAGSLIDLDAPLMAFSGGAYGAARVARASLRVAQTARMSPRAALRASSAVQGVNAGIQGGALVGAADAYWRETVGWQDMANMVLQSAMFGGAVGGAINGDIRTSVSAAQREFHERVARDDPSLQPLNVNELLGDNLAEYIPQERVDDGSLSAAQAQPVPQAGQSQPVAGATNTNQQWIDAARDWDTSTGFSDSLDTAMQDEWWARIAMHPVANITTNNFRRLLMSESRVARFVAGSIFESANGLGRGRATAATRVDNYHRRIQSFLGEEVRSAQAEWARANNRTWQRSGYHISSDGQQVFNREVMLELNDRRLGRSSSRSPEIRRAADQYELAGLEALNIGRGRDGEMPVDGFDTIPDSRGYTPYRWSGGQINRLEQNGVVSRAAIVSALSQSYRDAGMAMGKDADAVANAVVHRALSQDADMDMSVFSLLTADGKDFLEQSLEMAGVGAVERQAIMDRLIGAQHNRSRESFAKTRNDVDMNTPIQTLDGSDLRIVDLMDQDMHGVWQRYARQMSGSAALARHGITNRAKRTEVIDAMRAEQRALGEEPMDRDLLEAMFSHFNAGPVQGYAAGKTNEGIGHLALVKRMTNLALLERLGIAQLAETGVTIAQNGLVNWMQRGPMAVFNRELRQGNDDLLRDMAFFTGEIGKDHWHFAPWLDLDDVATRERGDWLHTVNRFTQGASFVQGYTSAFNQVRGFQQRTLALGMTDLVFRTLRSAIEEGRDLTPLERGRFESDLGLGRTELAELEALIHDGTIEFETRGNHTFVNRINADRWPGEIGETFASAITRNMNQLVQKSMAGEQDAWMHTHAGSLFFHLKTFPLQAIQKQVMRNARFMDRQAIATVLYGMASAAVAIQLRDTLDGREQREPMDLAKAAFSYGNMTGFIPTVYDPMMTLIGMDDARINQYGPNNDITPPAFSVANDMVRIPGAIANTIAGTDDWYDEQALRAIPFAGTYVLSRAFD